MIFLLYDIFLFLATPLFMGYLVVRGLRRGRGREGMAERLGFLSPEKQALLKDGKTIWVHAVSVGETMAAKHLLKGLRQAYPDYRILLSTTTETGRSVAEKLPECDLHVYFPFDYPFAVRRVLEAASPSLIVIIETEIWPNFARIGSRLGIPLVLANGRISDRSFPRYRLFRWFFSSVLPHFSAICTQTEEDARRMTAIGAPSGRVHVARNLKYDLPPVTVSEEEKQRVREKFHIAEGVTILAAASTHAGEEEAIIEAYKGLLRGHGRLMLILVPRHPERGEGVKQLLVKQGFSPVVRSALAAGDVCGAGGVFLVDTVGELMQIYSVSDIVFVGGSLVPVGGHNLLEPASLSVPVVFGPHMSNFREISRLILERGAGVQLPDGASLYAALASLLANPQECLRMGASGARLLADNVGATSTHLKLIGEILPARQAAC